MKKKAITMKLSLNKETLRNLSTGDLRVVVGGVTARCSNFCEPTGASDCYDCGVTTLSGGSCPSGMACC